MPSLPIVFDIVTRPHAAIAVSLQAIQSLQSHQRLPFAHVESIVKGTIHAPQNQYARLLPQLEMGDYVDFTEGGSKRLHVFCDPQEPDDFSRMLLLQSRLETHSGTQVEMPDRLQAGARAPFALVARLGCCKGRTLIHGQDGQAIKKVSSIGDMVAQIATAWAAMPAERVSPETIEKRLETAISCRIS